MPIDVAIWRMAEELQPLSYSAVVTEERLETLLEKDVSVLGLDLLVIGRQVPTSFGKLIDILAIDGDGNLVVIELKRNRTPREVIAQLLDYGSWVRHLEDEDIASIFDEYRKKYQPHSSAESLDEAFQQRFGVSEMPDTLNESHELVVVARELDASTERIVGYLAEEYNSVAINGVFFRCFEDEGREYLSRAWLIDPAEVEAKAVERKGRQPWNGECYVSFGEGPTRRWSDARKYGFIAGGGGSWYIKTLSMLEPGNRVWVNVPKQGYVGVGRVVDLVVPVTEFLVEGGNGEMKPITEMPLEAPRLHDPNRLEDKAEHLVRVSRAEHLLR